MKSTMHDSIPNARARLGVARSYALTPFAHDHGTRRFLILTSGRAGSELLVSLLQSHPLISCDAELLNQTRLWPDRLLAGRVARAAQRGSQAYGVKLQPQHILDLQHVRDPEGWVRSLQGDGWQVIRLGRLNRLHQAISVMKAAMSQWHYRHGNVGTPKLMALDPNAVVGTMYLIQHRENQIVEMLKDVEHLELTYEDHLRSAGQQAETVAMICRMLDIEPLPTATDLTRVTPEDIRDSVANYDEIADVIRRNAFVEYLTE
jgi:LPS sulfotransferase NodH